MCKDEYDLLGYLVLELCGGVLFGDMYISVYIYRCMDRSVHLYYTGFIEAIDLIMQFCSEDSCSFASLSG